MALPVFQRTIVTEAGDVIAGAEVEVVLESTGLAADIFSDRAGNTALTNPFFTGADGFAKFFAAPAEYRITATGPTGSIVFRFVVLTGDIARQDAGSVNISGGAISSTNVTGGTVNPTTLQQGGSQAYVRNNILGTVSESSGVPTGAIIQRGSNANGEFVRYADGTQICTAQSSSSFTTTNAKGALFFNNGPVFTFPVAFISTLIAVPNLRAGAGEGGAGGFTVNITSTSVQIGISGFVNTDTGSPGYIAIGRWF